MKKKMIHRLQLWIMLGISVIFAACTTGRSLKTEEINSVEMQHRYNLILYGGRFSDDRETLAILDKASDKYEFVVYAPDYDYRIERKVPAKKALEKAEQFVRFHHSFYRSILSRILGPDGSTLGYEVKPLYLPLEIGYSDLIDVHYSIIEETVIVKIRLRPEAEDRLFERDTPLIFRGR